MNKVISFGICFVFLLIANTAMAAVQIKSFHPDEKRSLQVSQISNAEYLLLECQSPDSCQPLGILKASEMRTTRLKMYGIIPFWFICDYSVCYGHYPQALAKLLSPVAIEKNETHTYAVDMDELLKWLQKYLSVHPIQ